MDSVLLIKTGISLLLADAWQDIISGFCLHACALSCLGKFIND